ncbi:MAG TPA: RluA family pseudouridine synthase [Anaerolineaceae bacterium]|nr:RluA family pseudouridine synthase [Anaerolineaceae bacterium]
MSLREYEFHVKDATATRLDKFLAQHLPDTSRSRLQALVKEGMVQVNGTLIQKTGFSVEAGDRVTITIPEPVAAGLVPETTTLDILFENKDVVVINKSAGMVVHPSPGHASGTLVHAALGNFSDLEGIGGELRPGIVHRLDKDTSGIILMAKNEHALRWLQDQFRLRKVRKIYLALVDGKPPTPSGRVEAAIARDPAHRKQMAIVPDGKGREAITEYRTLRQFPQHTLIEAHPLTGRTHQIRLHMAFLHCPIVGDVVYGRKKPSLPLERHFLHAAQLSVVLPGDEQSTLFQAPLPQELQQVLNDLISVYGEGNENH